MRLLGKKMIKNLMILSAIFATLSQSETVSAALQKENSNQPSYVNPDDPNLANHSQSPADNRLSHGVPTAPAIKLAYNDPSGQPVFKQECAACAANKLSLSQPASPTGGALPSYINNSGK
jgi:cytochrome c5